MTSFVIDASVIAGWLLEDEQDEYALETVDCLRDEIAIAPAFMWIELGNVLLNAERNGRITASKVEEYLDRAISLELALEPLSDNVSYAPGITFLAQKQYLTTYDAMYLELAMRHKLPIATLDQTLAKAAKKCGVDIFKP